MLEGQDLVEGREDAPRPPRGERPQATVEALPPLDPRKPAICHTRRMADQSQYGASPGGPPAGGPPAGASRNLGEYMSTATKQTRRFSPGFFGVIALCFLLPFVSITCTGSRIVTITGLDFITGAKVEIDKEFQESLNFGEEFDTGDARDAADDVQLEGAEDDRVDRNPFAIAALAAAIVGLVLTLVLKRRGRDLAATILAGLVLLGLLIFRFDTNNDAAGGEGVVAVEYRFGWWVAVVLSAALVAAHASALRKTSAPGAPGQPPSSGGSAPPREPAPNGPPPGTSQP